MITEEKISPSIESVLASRFEEEAGIDYPRGVLNQMVLDGTLDFQIIGKTVPKYAFWYYVQSDNMLHCNAALSLSKENRLSELFESVEHLANNLRCRGVVFETRFAGIIRQSRRADYYQSAVVMKKEFPK